MAEEQLPGPAEAERGVLTGAMQASFSGPLPPPIALQGYDMVVPGAAERILRMAEVEQAQTHVIQMKVVDQQVREGTMARWTALALPAFGLSMAAVVILTGHEVSGGAIGVAALGAPLIAAVLRRSE